MTFSLANWIEFITACIGLVKTMIELAPILLSLYSKLKAVKAKKKKR
jgi:hypothetical protein